MINELIPCPFCHGGETHITEHRNPGVRMDGKLDPVISVEIRHFCPRRRGVVHNSISIRGRDRQSAIDAWNYRP